MNDNKIKKLGLIIKYARKEQGLTQLELAGVSGVGVRFIRDLEHGKESCHVGKTFKIISNLGIEIFMDDEKLFG